MMKDGTENVYMFVNFLSSDTSREKFDLIFLHALLHVVLNFLAMNFYSIF